VKLRVILIRLSLSAKRGTPFRGVSYPSEKNNQSLKILSQLKKKKQYTFPFSKPDQNKVGRDAQR